MRTRVYTFKPKGRGCVYVTETFYDRRGMSSTPKSRRAQRKGGVVSGMVCNSLARIIVHGFLGIK